MKLNNTAKLKSKFQYLSPHQNPKQQTLTHQNNIKKYKTLTSLFSLQLQRQHYRDLPQHLQSLLGTIPEGFINYFKTRFPNLLIHSYNAMSIYKHDTILQHYYN